MNSQFHSHEEALKGAMDGNIHAFHFLFDAFRPQLRSYIFRLTANFDDAEDLVHDTFLRAFDHISTYRGEAALKSWVFQIATNLALNLLSTRARWVPDVKQRAKALALSNSEVMDSVLNTLKENPAEKYELTEHIDACFTCLSKTLPLDEQIAVILKDVYDFSLAEMCLILEKSEGKVKYLLQGGRKKLMEIFEHKCALISKMGVCHQCSELNGIFNSKQQAEEEESKLDLVKNRERYEREALYSLRVELIRGIDPLQSRGPRIQAALLKVDRMAMGEVSLP
ncbi:MAG: RNA polymerase sigma factor [Chloroherpetonaceae bacterium]|nr:RNA polymerase sigma factor [Chloroherpetonaceae bacterium]